MRDYGKLIALFRAFGAECSDPDCCRDCQFSGFCDHGFTPDEIAAVIEELVAAVPKWISVEKPPDNGRNIFICHGNVDFKAPCIGHYDPNMKLFYEDRNWFASPIYDAMFWCEMPELPLPEPPKEELNEV